jgi:hypothetical protein
LRAAGDKLADDVKALTFAMREARGGFVDENGDWLETVEDVLPKVEADEKEWREARGG